jgi:hypothetical protein
MLKILVPAALTAQDYSLLTAPLVAHTGDTNVKMSSFRRSLNESRSAYDSAECMAFKSGSRLMPKACHDLAFLHFQKLLLNHILN